MHHDQSRLPSSSYQVQGHYCFAAAGWGRQSPEVFLRHGLHGLNLEVVEVTLETEIDLRQRSASILNPMLHSPPLQNPHKLPGDPPGKNQGVSFGLVAFDLPLQVPRPKSSPVSRPQGKPDLGR